MDDKELLAQAEQALTEIRVAKGLTEQQASVLAALRIRLRGVADRSLEEMLEAAGDVAAGDVGSGGLEDRIAEVEGKPKTSLDDLLSKPKPKPEWPS